MFPLRQLERLLPLLLPAVCCCLGVLASCMDDEGYTLSPDARLEFSTDTVAFDTVISGRPTNTYTFMVYNRNDEAVRLARVGLEKGSESPFRVNVDGTFLTGGSGTDFEIAANDSMRVFLEMTAAEHDSDTPVETIDKLLFRLQNGVQQHVTLTAYGQDVVELDGVVLSRDTLLNARRPYHVLDSLVVAEGTTLTIGEGVRFYFEAGASLVVHGTLLVQGTAAHPVVFRGDRLGNMFSDQPYDRIPGQWGGITITSTSYGNIIAHADIHSGNYGVRIDSADTGREKLQLLNSILHNVKGDALSARSAYVTAVNTQLTNAGGNCVTLRGGDNVFIHCTIANFYAFAGGRGVALDFANYDGDARLPLLNAAFLNCIITGYSSDEVMGAQSERYADDAFNYLFRSCLLNTPPVDDPRIVNCLWDNEEHPVSRDKNFAPEFDLDKLIFTFTLSPRSMAVGTADPELSLQYAPTDIMGIDRTAEGRPNMGCYQAVWQAEE